MSRLTHAHPRSQIACGIYTQIALNLFAKQPLLTAMKRGLSAAQAFYEKDNLYAEELTHYKRLLHFEDFIQLPQTNIKSSG